MPAIKDNAICIRLLDWSETSQIAVLLTENHGKVSATAKGAKRQYPSAMSKFSGGLELLTLGEAVFTTKRTTELANLTEWDLLDPLLHLRQNLRTYELAMYAADLAHHLLQDHDPHPQTYRSLAAFLSELKAPPSADLSLLRFQWDVVRQMGLMPVLDRDAETGGPLPAGPTLAFSPSAGGVVADTGRGDRWRVRRSTVEFLIHGSADPRPDAPDPASVRRANRLLCAYFRAVLDKELPTMPAILSDD